MSSETLLLDRNGFVRLARTNASLRSEGKTTGNYKVGDKVYVKRDELVIRATVAEVGIDRWGYRLRAFKQDLPGIYMFNVWDKDLSPRTGKTKPR